MPFGCFRPRGAAVLDNDFAEACRAKPRSRPANDRAKSSKFHLNRHGSADSRSSKTSTCSNESISKLPPCSRVSDPGIDAMMMPLPAEARPSRCLRLSQPRIYGDIVSSMKCEKGCRDWRNFAVFYDDDVDMNKSADEVAKKVAESYERKWRQLNSFASTAHSRQSDEVDMIG